MSQAVSAFDHILILCRPGFEVEAGQEIQHRASDHGVYGYLILAKDQGRVQFKTNFPEQTEMLYRALPVESLIFCRDIMVGMGPIVDLDPEDRVSGLIAQWPDSVTVSRINPWWLDTNEGKSLAKLAQKIISPLKRRLEKNALYNADSEWQMNLLFDSGLSAFIGKSLSSRTLRWPCGIAHLKMPAEAPSRSTLKLEEAILSFLSPQQQKEEFGIGKTAVDLGACPGGWTYQLVKRQLQVYAIDNGEMDPRLIQTGQVESIKADGFSYRPEHPVNWLVCDMIEQPRRVAELMARWVSRGDTGQALFNLKLPMKKRYEEVRRCFEQIDTILNAAQIAYHLIAKQLYHDREEITCYLKRA